MRRMKAVAMGILAFAALVAAHASLSFAEEEITELKNEDPASDPGLQIAGELITDRTLSEDRSSLSRAPEQSETPLSPDFTQVRPATGEDQGIRQSERGESY